MTDRDLELLNGMYQAMEVIKSGLDLRQQTQITNNLVDRNTCDGAIQQSAKILKGIIAELNKG